MLILVKGMLELSDYGSLYTLAENTVEVKNNIERLWGGSASDSQRKRRDGDSSILQCNLVNNKTKQLELPVEMQI